MFVPESSKSGRFSPALATLLAEVDDVISSAVTLARSIVDKIPPGALGVVKQQLSHHQPLD